MASRNGKAHRWFVLLVVTTAMLALGAQTARADLVTVQGGQTSLEPDLGTVYQLLFAPNYIRIEPVAPATLEWAPVLQMKFPINGGLVESGTMLGTVNHSGGLVMRKYNLSTGQYTDLQSTELKIVNGNTLVGNALGLIPAPTADLVNTTTSVSSGTINYEADVRLSSATATVLNLYFNTEAFKPGMNLGRLKASVQTRGLLG